MFHGELYLSLQKPNGLQAMLFGN